MVGLGMVARIVSQVMTLVLLLLAGRFLTIELFGVFALAVILLNFSQTIMFTGVYAYLLKEPDIRPTLPTAFTVHSALAVFFFLAILLVGFGISFIPGQMLLAQLVAATCAIPLISLLSCWLEALALRRHKVRYYYLSLLTSEVLGFALGVWMLLNDYGVWSLVASRYVTYTVIAAMLFLAERSLPRPGWNRDHARRITNYGAGLYGSAALTFLTLYWSDIAIGALLNARAVGLFRMGARTATAAFDIFAQTTRVLAWQVTGRYSREGRLQEPVWVTMYASLITLVAAGLGSMAVLGEDLTLVILGEDWLPMVPVLQLVCLVRIIATFDLVAAAQLAAAGDTKFLFRVRVGEAIILFATVFAGVAFGPVGVAVGMLPPAIYVAVRDIRRILSSTDTDLRAAFATIWPAFVIALATVGAAAIGREALSDLSPLLRLGGASLIGIAGFCIGAFIVFRRWTMRQIRALSDALMPAREPAEIGPDIAASSAETQAGESRAGAGA